MSTFLSSFSSTFNSLQFLHVSAAAYRLLQPDQVLWHGEVWVQCVWGIWALSEGLPQGKSRPSLTLSDTFPANTTLQSIWSGCMFLGDIERCETSLTLSGKLFVDLKSTSTDKLHNGTGDRTNNYIPFIKMIHFKKYSLSGNIKALWVIYNEDFSFCHSHCYFVPSLSCLFHICL